MKLKIDRGLLPIKAHFFFFFAALGPLLPQMNVFGRQLGVSPAAMGMVTAVLPLLWAAAKPLFGYIVDFWPAHRKLVFMLLIAVMTGSYSGLWFLPIPDPPPSDLPLTQYVYNLNDTIYLKTYQNDTALEKFKCHWNCSMEREFPTYLSNTTFINTLYVDGAIRNDSCSLFYMDLDDVGKGGVTCAPKSDCNLLCYEDEGRRRRRDVSSSDSLLMGDDNDDDFVIRRNRREISNSTGNFLMNSDKTLVKATHVIDKDDSGDEGGDNFYMTAVFWVFVVLMCVGTVAFNVANCIGDAVCFDVLGPNRSAKYGAQRAWGTAGYGFTALLGGWLVDAVSPGAVKDFTPAFVLALAATAVDLYACRALTLPAMNSPEDSGAALVQVLKMPRVIVFILFAIVAGTFDSFIIYYMFWFLEELAETTGHMAQIKFIEGVIIAGQSFLGEMVFFYFSGKIIKRWGYGATMSVSLFCYALRMALIAVIHQPWHLVAIEILTQGPTYALCYACIVGYAAQVAPEGYSATVQGIVAGMDDGVGFALGSLVGGQLYTWAGGRGSFRIMAIAAATAATIHSIWYAVLGRQAMHKEQNVEPPELPEGEKMLPEIEHAGAIYRDTVVPINGDKTNS